MAEEQVLRVIIDGRGLDLMNALQCGKVSALRALTASTGRNVFTIMDAMSAMESTKDERSLSEEDQAAARMARLAGKAGAKLTDAITDLVFLARRLEGDKSTLSPDQPITYDEVSDELSFMEAMGALSDVSAQLNAVEEDPTTAPTVSDRGASNGAAHTAMTGSKTS